MELRHLRYFLAVGEALSFTKAAARLRVAQPALSRQVQNLEDEIGVDLLRRSPRGVTLTAEGKLFLEEVRELLKRTGESVEKVRALAGGEYGELQVGYLPTHTVEILPPGLAAFRKSVPHAKVSLYDLSCDELITGLRNATLELAITLRPTGRRHRVRIATQLPVVCRGGSCAPFCSSEIHPLGEGRCRTTHRTPPQGFSRVLS
jgi:DNA-binding transcriptional LysR family regulator